jgi:hypothetical protein
MWIPVPPHFLHDFTESVARARAEGRGDAVLRLWRELARVVLALSVRTRGWQMQIAGTGMALLPGNSASSLLGKVYGLAGRLPLVGDSRSRLQQLSPAGRAEDVVARSVQVLSSGVSASDGLSDTMAREITESLLECVAASAAEFEATPPRSDPLPYPATGEPDLEMASWIVSEPVRPRPGKEVDAALEYCKELAHVLLVRDLSFMFDDPPETSGGRDDVRKETERAVALVSQGTTHYENAEHVEAEELFRQAMSIFYEVGRLDFDCGWEGGVIACRIPLARIVDSREEAIALMDEAVAIGRGAVVRRREQSVELLAVALNELGHCHGDSDAAVPAMREAVEMQCAVFLRKATPSARRLARFFHDYRALCKMRGQPPPAEVARMGTIAVDSFKYEVVPARQAKDAAV